MTSVTPRSTKKTSVPKKDGELLDCLLKFIPDRIYFKDRNGRFLRVSQAQAEFLGASAPSEVIGKSDFDYFARELAEAAFEDEKQVMETGVSITGKVEKKLLLDGRTGWALVAKIPLRDSSGDIVGTCGISKDITTLKDTEEALHAANSRLAVQKTDLVNALRDLNSAHDELHATHQELKTAQQRMVEFENVRWIARLAFGVAHEIRNPLGALEMGVSYLSGKNEVTSVRGAAETLNNMSEAIQRADVVVSALMEGAASSGVAVKSDEIAATVEKAVEMMKSKRHVDGH